jgi:hypothetical protein
MVEITAAVKANPLDTPALGDLGNPLAHQPAPFDLPLAD